MEENKIIGKLFGVLEYSSIDDLDVFNYEIKNGDLSKALLVIQSGLRFAQAKGAFNLEESESLASAIRLTSKIFGSIINQNDDEKLKKIDIDKK